MAHVIVDGIRKDPLISGVYSYSLALQPGVVAANNFLTLMNPASSGLALVLGGAFFSSYGIGTTTATDPMRGFRITGHSGGTLVDPADVVKYDTRYSASAAELRFGTAVAVSGMANTAIFNSPPPLGTGGTIPQFVHSVEPPPGSGGFLMLPGQGVTIRTAAGDVDQLWNITIVWGEGRPF